MGVVVRPLFRTGKGFAWQEGLGPRTAILALVKVVEVAADCEVAVVLTLGARHHPASVPSARAVGLLSRTIVRAAFTLHLLSEAVSDVVPVGKDHRLSLRAKARGIQLRQGMNG